MPKKFKKVQVYFDEDVEPLYNDLVAVADATGLSQSQVALAAFTVGFYELVTKDDGSRLAYRVPVEIKEGMTGIVAGTKRALSGKAKGKVKARK